MCLVTRYAKIVQCHRYHANTIKKYILTNVV